MTLSSLAPETRVGIAPRLAELAKSAGINWIYENNGHYYAFLGDIAFHVQAMKALDRTEDTDG